jgi:hypothetical protein
MKTVVLGTVCLALAVGALAGCSARNAESSTSAAPSTAPSSSALPVIENTKGLVKLGWSSTSSTDSGHVIVTVENKDCIDPKGVRVEETSTTVTVAAWGAHQQEPCAAVGYALHGELPLQEPLGDRSLKHG